MTPSECLARFRRDRVHVGAEPPKVDRVVVRRRKDVGRVEGDGVDRGRVGPDLPDRVPRIRGPEAEESTPAARDHGSAVGEVGQPADPVPVGVREREDLLALLQIPELDARVPGSRDERGAVQGEALHSVVVGRVQVEPGREDPSGSVPDFKHLDVVILRTRDDKLHAILLLLWAARGAGRSFAHGEAHDGRLVASAQLPRARKLADVPDADLGSRGGVQDGAALAAEGNVVDERLPVWQLEAPGARRVRLVAAGRPAR